MGQNLLKGKDSYAWAAVNIDELLQIQKEVSYEKQGWGALDSIEPIVSGSVTT
jgi:hypothetical protein